MVQWSKDLGLAVALAVFVGLVSVLALSMFGLETATAKRIGAGILLVGIPYCHHQLARWTARRRVAAEGPPTLASYSLGSVTLLLLGTLWMLGAGMLISGLAGLAIAEADVELGPGVTATAPLVLVVLAWTAFSMGRWVGRRASRWAVAIATSVILLEELIGKGAEYALMPPDAYLSVYGVPKEPVAVLLGASIGILVLLATTILGVWRGTRTRQRSYMTYILEALPRDTQQLIIDMARDEAYRLALTPTPRSREPAPQPSGGANPAVVQTAGIRAPLVPLLSFCAGIASILITQAVAGRQQLAQARRENRVTALRDYASACSRTAVSLAQAANLPIHLAPISQNPAASPEKQLERIYRLYDEANTAWRQHTADLVVQADVVNALFRVKVDPIGATAKHTPPEFRVLPGEIDVEQLEKRFREDPLVFLKRYSPILGRQARELSSYCQASVQALSKEIE